MTEILKDILPIAWWILPCWVVLFLIGATITLALRLDSQKAQTRLERLRRARSDAAISFAASLERGTEARKFVLLFSAGFVHEIADQYPDFKAYMDARIAAVMGDRP
ncbi:hypothetical protein [Agrobacterium vitis]|uniref:hypothetical protein n=1 Tax=Agrobacterium vitis TaxID=373 RepID=UPI0008DC28FE|nr:hypothetical protein [Agrobacterium vitis]MUO84024.1 hypothetical protein [Agrobacterium vitis]